MLGLSGDSWGNSPPIGRPSAHKEGNDMTSKKDEGKQIARPMPEQIPDTPENVARVLMTTPPKRREDWDYLKR